MFTQLRDTETTPVSLFFLCASRKLYTIYVFMRFPPLPCSATRAYLLFSPDNFFRRYVHYPFSHTPTVPSSHRPPLVHVPWLMSFLPPAFAGALNWRTLGLFGVRMDAYSRLSWWLINHTSSPYFRRFFSFKKSYQARAELSGRCFVCSVNERPTWDESRSLAILKSFRSDCRSISGVRTNISIFIRRMLILLSSFEYKPTSETIASLSFE